MKRCVECGRPYRGGLVGPALLEVALDELGESGLDDERITDLVRVRETLRKAADRIDQAIGRKAEGMSGRSGD